MSTPELWKSWEGRTVDGKFPLRQWLGGSDHVGVFLTERPEASSKAAIKLVRAEGAQAERQLSLWKAATQFSHPHLLQIYQCGRSRVETTSVVYVVMEHAEEDLADILPQRALAPAEVTEMLPALLDALAYLHTKGFVHSRVKPSNVLAVGEQLKLSAEDAIPVSDSTSERRRRDVYDAPELASGTITPASDVWSVGVTLVAALTQDVPFSAEQSAADPGVPNIIPEPFRGIVRECLHVDPRRRCSIAEIQARLQPAARSVPAPAPPPPAPRRPIKRSPIAVAVALIVVLVALVAFLSRGKNTSRPAASKVEHTTPENPPPPKPTPSTPEPDVAPQQAVSGQGDVVRRAMPDISQSAQRTISGTIKITAQVEVDPSGKVRSQKLNHSGPSRYFADLCLKAAEQWEFTPPQVNGQPMPSTWLIQFRLKRNGTQASAKRVTR